MRPIQLVERMIPLIAVALCASLFLLACSSQSDPFLPSIVTPTAVPSPTVAPAAAIQPSPTMVPASEIRSSPTTVPAPVAQPSSTPAPAQAAVPSPTTQPDPVEKPTAQPEATNTPVPTQPAVVLREIDYTDIADKEVVDAEIVRFAEWDEQDVQLGNAMMAYIVFHGLRYRAEVVQIEDGDYQGALADGSVDIVLQVPSGDSAWLTKKSEAGAVLDVGSLFSDAPEVRVAVNSGLSDRAPEVVDILEDVSVLREIFSKRAATISGGRLGIKPRVAAQTFFKRNEAVWKTWVPNEVGDLVSAAIADGRVSYEPKTCNDGNQFTC